MESNQIPYASEGADRIRSQQELKFAHDLIAGILIGRIPCDMEPGTQQVLCTMRDVLCWALNHDHNTSFNQYLSFLVEYLRGAGYGFTWLPDDIDATTEKVSLIVNERLEQEIMAKVDKYEGARGLAQYVPIDGAKPVYVDKVHGTLEHWLLHCPGCSIQNEYFCLSVVHLSDDERLPAGYKITPDMTHEILLVSLDGSIVPDRNDWETFIVDEVLYRRQFACPSDYGARLVCRAAAKAVVEAIIFPAISHKLGSDGNWDSFLSGAVQKAQAYAGVQGT